MVMVVAPSFRMDELWAEATSKFLPTRLKLVGERGPDCRVAEIDSTGQHFALVSWSWLVVSAAQFINRSGDVAGSGTLWSRKSVLGYVSR